MKDIFEKGFFTGINYWDSVNATKMWQNFDESVIDADMRAMRAAGVSSLRVFPLWSEFQPIEGGMAANKIYEFLMDGKSLPDTEAGRAGVSEEMCRRFERFCALAEKNDLKLIVALITGQMSFGGYYPPAFVGCRNAMSNPTMVKWELRYVKYFVRRMREQNAIIGWDLGNEVEYIAEGVEPDEFYCWCSAIADAIRISDPTRPVISGFGGGKLTEGLANSREVADYCDIHTVHPYHFHTLKDPIHSMRPVVNISYRARIKEDLSGIPTFVQEFGAIGYMVCSYETEAAFYRGAALECLASGCHGIMWWCAFDQGKHTFNPYNWNTIGSQYGFFKEDRTEKPIVAENHYLQRFLEALPNGLPSAVKDSVILVPRESEEANAIFETSYLLAKQAGLNPQFAYALDPIPKSKLYFLPCPLGRKAITKVRWNELLENVKAGSTLFMSLSKGLFREIPETFGVQIHARYEQANHADVSFEGEMLPVDSSFVYEILPTTARVLATDASGKPVLFENDYGLGKTYLSVLPVEEYVGKRSGAFFLEDAPAYYRLYQEIAKEAYDATICRVSSRWVFKTEHIVGEDQRYLFLINHNTKEETISLDLDQGWRVKAICGEIDADGKITLRGNDGVLLLAERSAK